MDIAAKCLHSLPHIGKPDARMLIFADLRSVIFYQKLVKSRMLTQHNRYLCRIGVFYNVSHEMCIRDRYIADLLVKQIVCQGFRICFG